MWYVGGSRLGFLLVVLISFLTFASGASAITSTSRIVFALARDNGLPFSNYLSRVNTQQVPWFSVLFVCMIDTIFLLLPLGSTTAFSQLTAISTIGYQVSYAIPILFRITFSRESLTPGKFSLGKYSTLFGSISVIWCLSTSLFLQFPQVFPIYSSNMNYACVIFWGILFLGGIYWHFSARHFFRGPIRTKK